MVEEALMQSADMLVHIDGPAKILGRSNSSLLKYQVMWSSLVENIGQQPGAKRFDTREDAELPDHHSIISQGD
jgi:hypothetical protein